MGERVMPDLPPLFRVSWLLVTVSTAVVAGLFLGHALILGRFLDWMLLSGQPGLLSSTYPVFRSSAGRTGLNLFYVLAGIQVLAGLAFLPVALVFRIDRLQAVVAAAASVAWPAVHYGTGFGAVEAVVLGNTSAVSPEVVRAFLAWNVPIHTFHGVVLTLAALALLSVPLSSRRPTR